VPARPSRKVSSSAFRGDRPASPKKLAMSGAMLVHGSPSDPPSKVTEPIITASSGTVPAIGVSDGRPLRKRRTPTSPSRASSGASREKRLK
jgi:hypothetical protein